MCAISVSPSFLKGRRRLTRVPRSGRDATALGLRPQPSAPASSAPPFRPGIAGRSPSGPYPTGDRSRRGMGICATVVPLGPRWPFRGGPGPQQGAPRVNSRAFAPRRRPLPPGLPDALGGHSVAGVPKPDGEFRNTTPAKPRIVAARAPRKRLCINSPVGRNRPRGETPTAPNRSRERLPGPSPVSARAEPGEERPAPIRASVLQAADPRSRSRNRACEQGFSGIGGAGMGGGVWKNGMGGAKAAIFGGSRRGEFLHTGELPHGAKSQGGAPCSALPPGTEGILEFPENPGAGGAVLLVGDEPLAAELLEHPQPLLQVFQFLSGLRGGRNRPGDGW